MRRQARSTAWQLWRQPRPRSPDGPAGGTAKHASALGTFGSAAAAAVARDLGTLWRQLSTGADVEALGTKERYHFPPRR